MSDVAVAVMAHPDDAEVGCGGYLARLASEGYRTIILVASIPDYAGRRRIEAEQAARQLGAEVMFLEGPGNATEWQVEDIAGYALVRQLDALFSRLLPGIVITHWDQDNHGDHVALSRAVLASCRLLPRATTLLAEQPNRFAPNSHSFTPNFFVDISGFVDAKTEALSFHVSQERLRTYLRQIHARTSYWGSLKGTEHAEAFMCVSQWR
jgi:LmbE family N-acetylglucosaminyl deacetylase